LQHGLYVGLSAQRALLSRLDTLADNIANASTPGFRATLVTLGTLDSAKAGVSFADKGTTHVTKRTGEVRPTGNPYDVAIEGDAWLSVQTPTGQALTRDGRLTMSATGELRTAAGYAVLDSGGAAIQVDPIGGPPTIARTGAITQGNRLVGTLGLFRVEANAYLERGPDTTVMSSRPPIASNETAGILVRQGFLESSNVAPEKEITRLIAVQRLFDAVSSASSQTESAFLEGIRQLGGTSP
jgi:flagellar basal-body rod protein FlgF